MFHISRKTVPITLMTLDETLTSFATSSRLATFSEACRLAAQIGAREIVETGCMRTDRMPNPDGSSTCILGTLARDLKTRLMSIDNAIGHIEDARRYCAELPVDFNCFDSVRALSTRMRVIDFLYLDSYDFNEARYLDAQTHQLAELGAAFGKLNPRAIVLIDDCDLPRGGKSGLSRHFLALRGWTLRMNMYQQLWTNYSSL